MKHLLACCCLWLLGATAASADEFLASRENAPLTILHINDIYAVTEADGDDVGRLARVATLRRQLQEQGKNAILVLSGDFLSPSVSSSVFRGEHMIELLDATGLDIATIGNHEFDFGAEVTVTRMKEAQWPFVIANVVEATSGEPIAGAKPYLIRRYGDLKVGFLGLCTDDGSISSGSLRGYRVLDPVDTAAKYLPEMRQRNVDLVVAITHLGYDTDRRLAQEVPGIDLILGGHDHFPVAAMVQDTFISKTGHDAVAVARFDISAGGVKHYEMISIDRSDLEKDPQVTAIVDRYDRTLARKLNEPLAETKTPLNASSGDVRTQETNLGNLLTDAMRSQAEADVALMNGGGIRGDRLYPAGQLTKRDLVAMLPFSNTLCTVEISGALLETTLAHGVAEPGRPAGRFPQISGASFRVVGPGKIADLKVNGKPVQPDRTYVLALTDYTLSGGDDYDMLKRGNVLVSPEEGELLVTAIAEYLSQAGTVAPVVENRIRFAP